jgi:small subunit ribosomal protein S12
MYATVGNRVKNWNKRIYHRPRRPILKGSPQRRGLVIRVRFTTPRKPNSARRPVAKAMITSGRRTISHIPGKGHSLKRYSKIFINGVGARDLPGVNYSCMRGHLDFEPLRSKTKRRSIYAVPRDPLKITYVRRKLRELVA